MGGEEQYLFILLGGEGQYPFIPLGGEGQYLFILLGGEGQYPFILLSGGGLFVSPPPLNLYTHRTEPIEVYFSLPTCLKLGVLLRPSRWV